MHPWHVYKNHITERIHSQSVNCFARSFFRLCIVLAKSCYIFAHLFLRMKLKNCQAATTERSQLQFLRLTRKSFQTETVINWKMKAGNQNPATFKSEKLLAPIPQRMYKQKGETSASMSVCFWNWNLKRNLQPAKCHQLKTASWKSRLIAVLQRSPTSHLPHSNMKYDDPEQRAKTDVQTLNWTLRQFILCFKVTNTTARDAIRVRSVHVPWRCSTIVTQKGEKKHRFAWHVVRQAIDERRGMKKHCACA